MSVSLRIQWTASYVTVWENGFGDKTQEIIIITEVAADWSETRYKEALQRITFQWWGPQGQFSTLRTPQGRKSAAFASDRPSFSLCTLSLTFDLGFDGHHCLGLSFELPWFWLEMQTQVVAQPCYQYTFQTRNLGLSHHQARFFGYLINMAAISTLVVHGLAHCLTTTNFWYRNL